MTKKPETVKLTKIGRVRPRTWKDYFANAPRLPADFPKRIRDRRPEKVDQL
jgi:hypothetical protein